MFKLFQYVRIVLIVAFGLLLATQNAAIAQQPEPRIALLIGNQAYASAVGSLKNPYNDVKLVAAALQSTGFSVTVLKDVSRLQILASLRVYARRLNAAGPDAVGFFYYSGHGASETSIGPNYLIPVNVKSTDNSSLWDASIQLGSIIRRLKRGAPAAAHFVVFDACRNELRTREKSLTKGFVPEQSESGVYIAFATAQNSKASDQGEGSGPYARALAEQIVQPGQHHMDMFFNVKTIVRRTIRQTPWDRNGLLRRIYFGGRSTRPPAITASASAPSSSSGAQPLGAKSALELSYWATIKNSGDPDDFKDYMSQFPKGIFRGLASRRITSLGRESTKLATPALSTPQYNPDFPFDRNWPFDGSWVGEHCSLQFRRLKRVCKLRVATIKEGKIFTQWGRKGRPGSGTIKGRISGSGGAFITLSGIAGQARNRGRRYVATMSGQGSRFKITLSGKYSAGRGVRYNLTRSDAPPPIVTGANTVGQASAVQRELKRLGCYSGSIDGKWGSGSRRAVSRFNDHANAALTSDNPQSISLSTLKIQKGRVCPNIDRQIAKRPRTIKARVKQTTVQRASTARSSCRLETRSECKRRVCLGGGCGLKGTGICKYRNRRRIC